MKYKLDQDQMAEAEMVTEQMSNDPDAIAFELVWRRCEMARVAELIQAEKRCGSTTGERLRVMQALDDFASANDRCAATAPHAGPSPVAEENRGS